MEQTRIGSLIEAAINIAIGYWVALLSQIVVFPLFGINVPLSTNLWIGAWFTVISLVRSYIIRRWFNGRLRRLAQRAASRLAPSAAAAEQPLAPDGYEWVDIALQPPPGPGTYWTFAPRSYHRLSAHEWIQQHTRAGEAVMVWQHEWVQKKRTQIVPRTWITHWMRIKPVPVIPTTKEQP